jgi:ribosome-associated toxin RatA of RatAB toxin-antitoxin module
MIRAVLHIEASREHVFATLTDYPRYKEWFPGCEHSTIISRTGGSVDAEFIINRMKRVKVWMRFEAQPTRALSFRMISGRDLKSYSGSYRLMDSPDGKGTIVIAEMRIEVAVMVPSFVVNHVARKSIDDTGNSLRRYLKRVLSNPQTPPQRHNGYGDSFSL